MHRLVIYRDTSPSCEVSAEVLTDERVGDVRPVDAVLQLQLVVGLDVEQEVLVEADSGDQVSPVGALQGAAAVDVLREEDKNGAYETPGTPHNLNIHHFSLYLHHM